MRTSSLAVFFTMLALVICLPVSAAGQTIHVPDDYATIQAALDAADDLYTIIVRDGVYTGDGNKNLDFGGKALTLRSENGPDNCVIDCEGAGRGFNFHSGETAASILDGFTITNGYASSGGGILCDNSSPYILNCIISGNTAALSMIATSGGGGISCIQSSAAIVNCTIVGNSTEDDLHGGGIMSIDSSPYIANCNINGNTASYRGGGVFCNNSSAIIIDCNITGNSAFQGGGVCFTAGTPWHGDPEKEGNISVDAERENSLEGASPVIINSVIIGNTALQSGGAIFCDESSPGIIHCTISGNQALQFGGGVCTAYGASPYVSNSILWNDSAPAGPELALVRGIGMWTGSPSSLSVSYSDIEGGYAACLVAVGCTLSWGSGNIDADPLFVVPGSWSQGEWGAGDYHLTSLSPCIDTGIDFGILSDSDGDSRPLGAGYDIGADEFAPSTNNCPLVWSEGLEPSSGNTRTTFRFTAYYYDEDGDAPAAMSAVIDGVSHAMVLLSGLAANGTYYCDTRLGDGAHTYYFSGVDANGCAARWPAQDNLNGPSVIPAAEFYVPDDYPTIQAALDACIGGETIIVRDGVYSGAGNKNLDFRGKALALRSENGPDNCTIDCEGDGRGFNFHRNEGPDSIVDGFTITNGDVTAFGHVEPGGGVNCDNSSPTIINCVITGNAAQHGGGFACSNTASPMLSNCVVSDNIAVSYGGGIFSENSTPNIIDCTISGNSAEGAGGIFSSLSTTNITACVVAQNFANQSGGGIQALTSTLTIRDSAITANSANQMGGGIFSGIGSTTIANCVIANNSAAGNGGGILSSQGSSLTLSNCTITGNTTDEYGGGLSVDYQTSATIIDCILSANSAARGNAIALLQGSSSTVSFSDIHGEGETTYADADSTLNTGAGVISADPLFATGPLGAYYLSLVAAGQANDSPCVNAGSDTSANLGLNLYTTRVDDMGDSGLVDMGYHYEPVETTR